MNRSVTRLLSVAVLAPAAVLAGAAAPAAAAPGPSTTLLYDAYAQAEPVTGKLPPSVAGTAGPAAERATRTIDGLLGEAPGGTEVRTAHRCVDVNGLGVNKAAGKAPLDVLSKADCLGAASRVGRPVATKARPRPAGGAGDASGLGILPGGVGLGSLDSVRGKGLVPLQGAVPQAGRVAQPPLSIGLAGLPPTLGAASPVRLPTGAFLPSAARAARPGPDDDVLGRASALVDGAGAALEGPEKKLGTVVKVLKSNKRTATSSHGPVSLLDDSGLGLPRVPGLG